MASSPSSAPAIVVRSGAPSDWDFYVNGVQEILALQGNRWSPSDEEEEREILARLLSEDRVLVVDDLGFLLFEIQDVKPWLPDAQPCEPYIWINVVYVSGRSRGQGIGRLLYDEVERRIRKEGFCRMLNDVYENNQPSVLFHRRLGFKTIQMVDKKKRVPGEAPLVLSPHLAGLTMRALPGTNVLVASLGDNNKEEEVARLAFTVSQVCPYGGGAYGKYDWPYLHVDSITVDRALLPDAQDRAQVAASLFRRAETLFEGGVEHILFTYSHLEEEESSWSKLAGLHLHVHIFEKLLT